MSRKGCVLLLIVIVIAVLAAAFARRVYTLRTQEPPVSTEVIQEREGVPVEFDAVTRMDFPDTVGFWGEIESLSSITILAETNGTIHPAADGRFLCEVGRRVEVGEPLMVIENPDLAAQRGQALAAVAAARANLAMVQSNAVLIEDAQIASAVIQAQSAVDQAEAAYEDAKLDRDRILGLIYPDMEPPANPCAHHDDQRFRSVSRSQCNKVVLSVIVAEKQLATAFAGLDAAKIQREIMVADGGLRKQIAATRSQVEQAQAALEQVDAQAAKTRVASPVSGVVTMKMADPGDSVFPGSSLCVLQAGEGLKAVFSVGERQAALIASGDPVELRFSANPDIPLTIAVSSVYPVVDRGKQVTVEAVISLDDLAPMGEYAAAVKPGASFEGVVTRRILRDQLSVVYSALIFKGDDQGVFEVRDGEGWFVPVEIGPRYGDRVMLLSGLEEGRQVVAVGGERLFDGVKVRRAELVESAATSETQAE